MKGGELERRVGHAMLQEGGDEALAVMIGSHHVLQFCVNTWTDGS